MNPGGWELITTDESTVITESLPDAIVVEDGESNGRLSDSRRTNESDRFEALCETNNLLDNPVASEARPREGRQLSDGDAMGK